MLRSVYGKLLDSHVTGIKTILQRFSGLCILCILLIPMVAFEPPGESQVVTLNFKDAPLSKVLTEIRKQTGYTFTYSETDLAKAKPITVFLTNAKIFDALTMVLQGQSLTYTVIDNVIIIKGKTEKTILQEQRVNNTSEIGADVSGKVINVEDEPVAGVMIQVKGNEKKVTVTNGDGEYLLRKVEASSILVVSGVNIEGTEVPVNGQNKMDIRVKGKTGKLDEVQVIAYGKSSQRFSLGPVISVKANEIEKQPINNPLLALSGRVPGLVVTPANGLAGGGVTVRIQGRNNLDNTLVGSDPFIVIDGVPYASQNLSTFKGGGDLPILGSSSDDGLNSASRFGSPLAFINPADIESITVLRDADATAIYGSRAANGAILISTKKGKVGSIKTDINLQYGWGKVPQKMDLLNTQQYMEMRREGKFNDGAQVRQTDYDLRGVWDTTRYTDWQEELIGGAANYTRTTAGVSGGAESVQYLVSATYGKETTVFPGNFANAFGALHFNLSASSKNSRLKVQLGGSFMSNSNKLPSMDYTSIALNLAPVAPPLYNTDGTLNWAPDPITGRSTWYNPISRQGNLFETKTDNLIGNGSIIYQLFPGLEIKGTFGYTSTSSNQFITSLDITEKPEFRDDRLRFATFSYNTSKTWIVEPQITWASIFGPHSLNFLVGTTFQYQNNDGRGFMAFGHASDLLLRDMLAGGLSSSGIDINEYKYNAIFGRLNYMFHSKYLLNFSARRDGSSRFGPKSQFSNFGAIGVGWIFSEEKFMRKIIPALSFGKFRASYGLTGNDQIGNYLFMNLYTAGFTGIPYQGASSSSTTGLPNPYLAWEETRKFQIGIDLGFLKDRLLITTNYYRNRSSNSLTKISMPFVTGYNSLVTNLPALLQNSGWEFTLSSSSIKLGLIKWSSNLNVTFPRSKLIRFPGLDMSPLNGSMKIGDPLNSIYTYRYARVNSESGIYTVYDKDGTTTSTPTLDDISVVLNSSLRWYGGIQNSFQYKRFSIDFLFQYNRRYATHVYRLTGTPGRFSVGNALTIYGNQPAEVMNRWQKVGDDRPYEKFSSTGSGLNYDVGDFNFKNASFLRLKNVSLSYSLADNLITKIGLKHARFFINAQNLFTISPYNGLDPETLSVGSVPSLRVIVFGLQASL